jgi:rhamnogalacturonyl hydrolase YesR
MLPPFLAAAGHYDEAIKQIKGYWKLLYSSEKQLLSHIWQDEKKVFIRKDFWGVGNGWAMAGIARVIKMLPPEMNSDKLELIEMVKILIDSALSYIREDGFFYDVIDNKDTFVETNFSQMLAYTMYRGMTGGWLGKWYQHRADMIRAAVDTKVDPYGLVQDVCGAPKFSSPGVAAEGQAFYLLMEAAANDYADCIAT